MPALLLLSYPLLVHLGVVWQQPLMCWGALNLMAVGLLHRALRNGEISAWVFGGLFAVASFALMRYGGGTYALYLPPLAWTGLLSYLFARSLFAGQTPLVTRIAAAMRELTPDLVIYTRKLTWLWASLIALLWLITAVLTVTGPLSWWSWFTNVISYGLIGSFTLAEYLYRRWRFRDYPHPGFVNYLRVLVRYRPQSV